MPDPIERTEGARPARFKQRQARIRCGDGDRTMRGAAVARPVPTRLYHFTSIDHLETIVQHGLLADTTAVATGLTTVEVGNRGIKERRRRVVPIGPRGMVADYTPFCAEPGSPAGPWPDHRSGRQRATGVVSAPHPAITAPGAEHAE